MLKTCIVLLSVSLVSSTTKVYHNYENSNFFVGLFQNAVPFSYPLNVCTATGIGSFATFQCNSNNTAVMEMQYTSSSCNGTATNTVTHWYNVNNTMNGVNYYGAFKCTGVNSYVKLALSISLAGCEASPFYVSSAVNVCVHNPLSTPTTAFKVYCDPDMAYLYYFLETYGCVDAAVAGTANATYSSSGKCNYLVNVATVSLYANEATCMLANSTDYDRQISGASSMSFFMSILIALSVFATLL